MICCVDFILPIALIPPWLLPSSDIPMITSLRARKDYLADDRTKHDAQKELDTERHANEHQTPPQTLRRAIQQGHQKFANQLQAALFLDLWLRHVVSISIIFDNEQGRFANFSLQVAQIFAQYRQQKGVD